MADDPVKFAYFQPEFTVDFPRIFDGAELGRHVGCATVQGAAAFDDFA
jgi:hypothetical protein